MAHNNESYVGVKEGWEEGSETVGITDSNFDIDFSGLSTKISTDKRVPKNTGDE